MSAFITRRWGGIGGGSVVTGTTLRTTQSTMKISDLAGKENFAIVLADTGLYYESSFYGVVAIHYSNGKYILQSINGEDVCGFNDTDGFNVLSFDSATGTITLNGDDLDGSMRFKGSLYFNYVGW